MLPHRAPQGGDAATLPERGAERIHSRGGLNPPEGRGRTEDSGRVVELRSAGEAAAVVLSRGVAAGELPPGFSRRREETQRNCGRNCRDQLPGGWRDEVRGVTEDQGHGNAG